MFFGFEEQTFWTFGYVGGHVCLGPQKCDFEFQGVIFYFSLEKGRRVWSGGSVHVREGLDAASFSTHMRTLACLASPSQGEAWLAWDASIAKPAQLKTQVHTNIPTSSKLGFNAEHL